jgi:ESCRT-I complex subunit TSG101
MSHRLIDLVAEDNAIEDTIYHLHRALNAGRIDLDRFLRVRVVFFRLVPLSARAGADSLSVCAPTQIQTTRVLAEEQFMKRALIERIQTSLPMGASVHPVHPGWT